MTRTIGSSVLALIVAVSIGSLIHFGSASSVARAGFDAPPPVTPLVQITDSLHRVTLQLDDRIGELSAFDSALATRLVMPVMSMELLQIGDARCAFQSETEPRSYTDAFTLNSRIISQRAFIDSLSSTVRARLALNNQLPMMIPCEGNYTSGFGYRIHPITGREKLHTGTDIAAPTGTPIYVSGNGVVVFAGVKTGYGNVVEVDHGYGYHTLYGHSSKLLVAVGDTVKRGDRIALVGSTGMSTGPHLHYEVIVDGAKVDPSDFLIKPLAPHTPAVAPKIQLLIARK
ncbi:MAG: M23 family metallopeptidase [Candidatus Kapaibacterium sp.]